MSDIESRLAAVKTRIATATQEEARNAVLRDHAAKQGKDALNTLKEEFGIDSLEEAEALKSSLSAQREKLVADLESKLNDMGA